VEVCRLRQISEVKGWSELTDRVEGMGVAEGMMMEGA
jgi:hypothetical protein